MQGQKSYQYYDLIMASFVSFLLIANLVGSPKVCEIAGVTFGSTLIFFPVTYLFGDILTEVYGYKRSRRVVWAGFAALIFASVVSQIVLVLPAAPEWNHQTELEFVFGQTTRIMVASLSAYIFGEFANSYVLAKMKILTGGKLLWTRILGSTLIGEALDTLIFYPLAFYTVWPQSVLTRVMITSYIFKVLWEILMIPFTYKLITFLKRVENEDFYDYKTDFSPFSIKT